VRHNGRREGWLAEPALPPDVRKVNDLPGVALFLEGLRPGVGAPIAMRLIEKGLLNFRGIAPEKILVLTGRS
jgi:hypothetical protein